MISTTIDINSKHLNIIKEDNYYKINFTKNAEIYYTGTEVENTDLEIKFPAGLGAISTAGAKSLILKPVINKPIAQLDLLVQMNDQSKITLTIEKIDTASMALSLLILNNSEHHLRFESIPFTIIDNEDKVLYKSILSDGVYEAEPKTYSVYKFNIEDGNSFNHIKMDQSKVIFSN